MFSDKKDLVLGDMVYKQFADGSLQGPQLFFTPLGIIIRLAHMQVLYLFIDTTARHFQLLDATWFQRWWNVKKEYIRVNKYNNSPIIVLS